MKKFALLSTVLGLSLAACGGSAASPPASSSAAPASAPASSAAASSATSGSAAAKPSASASAAPATGGQKVTITFANWADAEPATRPQIEKVIAAFEAANPDIQIKSVPEAFTDILQQDIVQTTAGNPPDVSQIAGNDMLALAATNALQPLDGIVPADFMKNIYPTEIELGKVNNQQIAMPWTVAPLALWYNKTVMKQAGLDPTKPPATLDDFMADMKAVKGKLGASGVVPFGIDTTNRSFGLDFNWPIMLTFGAQPIGDKANADTPQMQNYLQFIRTVNQQGYTLPGKKLGEFRPLMAQDKLAFGFDATLVQGVVESLNKSVTDQQFFDTWGDTAFPAGPDGKHYSVPTGHQLVMFKAAKNKPQAWKFMAYLMANKEAIEDYTLAGGSVPPTLDATTVFPKQMNTPIIQSYIKDVLPVIARPPWGPQYSKAVQPIMAGVEAAATGNLPLSDITKNMQSQLQQIYQK